MVYLHLHKHSAAVWLICKDKKRLGNFKSYNFMVNKPSQGVFSFRWKVMFRVIRQRRSDSHIKHARSLVVSHTDSAISAITRQSRTAQHFALHLKGIFLLWLPLMSELIKNLNTSSLYESRSIYNFLNMNRPHVSTC